MRRTIITAVSLALCACAGNTQHPEYGSTVTFTKSVLEDKIKGGWVGQTIGCTYGGPTEFKYKGGIIHDNTPIVWYDDYMYDTFLADPGLYDDVYMDLTFVEVMAEHGIDAPASVYATAFANADYKLWHANQAARYNILRGIMPPESGHWLNNPHADDIDFQIEADFIGMICPGMVNKASAISDTVGHIMNYGDGFYGGVYIGAMYALAFITDDIPYIVSEALKTIPTNTKYHTVIADVIRLHKADPKDWHSCWFEIEKRYGDEKGCPEGVFNGFSIDATLNSAYVVIGLLYGEGDFFKTMDISTRCGQDSDCNPASAAGILGVIYGYSGIPDYWKPGLAKVEGIDFPYTNISLEKIYGINLRLLGDVVTAEGGTVDEDQYHIVLQKPEPVAYEQAFEGIYPVERRVLKKQFNDSLSLEFRGNGVVLMGQVTKTGHSDKDYTAQLEVFIDGQPVETSPMPYDYIKRKYDIFHAYNLPVDGQHEVTVRVLNPDPDFVIEAKEMVVYATNPLEAINPNK